jgi:hypothetical protein
MFAHFVNFLASTKNLTVTVFTLWARGKKSLASVKKSFCKMLKPKSSRKSVFFTRISQLIFFKFHLKLLCWCWSQKVLQKAFFSLVFHTAMFPNLTCSFCVNVEATKWFQKAFFSLLFTIRAVQTSENHYNSNIRT